MIRDSETTKRLFATVCSQINDPMRFALGVARDIYREPEFTAWADGRLGGDRCDRGDREVEIGFKLEGAADAVA